MELNGKTSCITEPSVQKDVGRMSFLIFVTTWSSWALLNINVRFLTKFVVRPTGEVSLNKTRLKDFSPRVREVNNT